jgi:hypothetical protein
MSRTEEDTMTNAQIIAEVSKFHAKAVREGRSSDVAFALGALDALRGLAADCPEAWTANHGDYLAGWSKVHGI